MIKASGKTGDGKPLLILGLSRENLDRLPLDQPIAIRPEQLAELGMPEMTIVILGGETEQDIAEDISALGGVYVL